MNGSSLIQRRNKTRENIMTLTIAKPQDKLNAKAEPAETFSPRRVDNIRKGVGVYGCTQEYFAELLGIPTITYRNWEQGRKKPTGPARTLLRLVEHAPDAMAKLLKEINSRD